jgi:hypothetical protein
MWISLLTELLKNENTASYKYFAPTELQQAVAFKVVFRERANEIHR